MSTPTPIQFINGFYTGNNYLNQSQIDVNFIWFWQYLVNRDISPFTDVTAICAMAGNIQQESTFNPGLWQNRTINNEKGFGLVQWTPATKYLDWCKKENLTPQYMDTACERLIVECINSSEYRQWIPTSEFSISFEEFAVNSEGYDIDTATKCFLKCYERAGDERLEKRLQYARYFLAKSDVEIPPFNPPGGLPTPPGQFKTFTNRLWMILRPYYMYRRFY